MPTPIISQISSVSQQLNVMKTILQDMVFDAQYVCQNLHVELTKTEPSASRVGLRLNQRTKASHGWPLTRIVF